MGRVVGAVASAFAPADCGSFGRVGAFFARSISPRVEARNSPGERVRKWAASLMRGRLAEISGDGGKS